MPNEAIDELREHAVKLELRAKALEAEEAQRAEALPPATPTEVAQAAPATPEIPAAPLVPAPVAAAEQGPQPPPGKAPLTIADLNTISQAEAVARMDEIEWLERQEARS